jgi:hypothetical protein
VPVTVHIQELHSDVVPHGGGGHGDDRPEPPWTAEERWCAQRARAEWLARRTCAVDFDD